MSGVPLLSGSRSAGDTGVKATRGLAEQHCPHGCLARTPGWEGETPDLSLPRRRTQGQVASWRPRWCWRPPLSRQPREGRSGHILPHGLRKTIAMAISCLSSMNYVLYILVLPRASSEPHGAVVFPVQVRTWSSETSSNPLTCTTSQGMSPPSPQSTLPSHPHGPHLPLGPDTWASTAESSLQLTILPLQHANSSERSFT